MTNRGRLIQPANFFQPARPTNIPPHYLIIFPFCQVNKFLKIVTKVLLDTVYNVQDFGYKILDTVHWILDTEYCILDTGYRILYTVYKLQAGYKLGHKLEKLDKLELQELESWELDKLEKLGSCVVAPRNRSIFWVSYIDSE